MLKKTIKFEDLDGNMVEEEFYFNLSKAELIEWELSEVGGFSAYLERALDASKKGDSTMIGGVIKELITRSIGERGVDNRTFEKKNGDVARRFMETDAYSVLYMEFGTNASAAADFLTALAPKDMRDQVAAEVAKQKETLQLPEGVGTTTVPTPEPVEVPENKDATPWLTEDRDPTHAELRNMTPEQINQAWAAKDARDRARRPDTTVTAE